MLQSRNADVHDRRKKGGGCGQTSGVEPVEGGLREHFGIFFETPIMSVNTKPYESGTNRRIREKNKP
jgi:hypothetical protein